MLQRAIEESKANGEPNPDVMTYEELMALGDKLGKVAKGFKQEQIDNIPRRRMQQSDSHKQCAVCQEHYQVGEYTKQLTCKHDYHEECINPWLLEEKRCPVCNVEIDIDQLT